MEQREQGSSQPHTHAAQSNRPSLRRSGCLKVLDVGSYVAGPFAATLLGDMGAEVIKCERPGAGDPLRILGRNAASDGLSARWQADGRNKRSITLNIQTVEGQELLRELAGWADVLIENLRPGVLAAYGLDYDSLAAVNPRLVYVSVSGFGQEGPNRQRRAFDMVASAYGGMSHMNGFTDSPPVTPGLALVDYFAALLAAFGALEALRRRDSPGGTGRGEWVDCALYDPILRIAASDMAEYALSGKIGQRSALQPYRTADDRWISLVLANDKDLAAIAGLVGDQLLDATKDLTAGSDHVRLLKAIDAPLREWIACHDAAEVVDALVAADIAASVVNTVADLVADAHIASRGDLVTIANARGELLTMPGVVPRLRSQPGEVRWTGEALGASNRDVYIDFLGLDEETFASLVGRGVI